MIIYELGVGGSLEDLALFFLFVAYRLESLSALAFFYQPSDNCTIFIIFSHPTFFQPPMIVVIDGYMYVSKLDIKPIIKVFLEIGINI